jgi:hypothetical protein
VGSGAGSGVLKLALDGLVDGETGWTGERLAAFGAAPVGASGVERRCTHTISLERMFYLRRASRLA